MSNGKRSYADIVKGERKIGGLFNWMAAYQEEDENLAYREGHIVKQGIYDVIFMKYF
jgi:hypothetical protein